MKNIITIIFFILSSGCATITNDVTMDISNQDKWSIKKFGNHSKIEYICNENQTISVLFNNKLSTDGKVYFIFFVIPIHTAKLSDKPYSGVKVRTTYPEGFNSCTDGSIYLESNGKQYLPLKSKQDIKNKSICRHKWHLPIKEEGKFYLHFTKIDNCDIPSVELKYETEFNYNFKNL